MRWSRAVSDSGLRDKQGSVDGALFACRLTDADLVRACGPEQPDHVAVGQMSVESGQSYPVRRVRLDYHTVRENEDGTISVLPGDGSSNSILVHGSRVRSWHGYIYSGEFREIGA